MLEGAREESEAGSEPEGERPVGEIVAALGIRQQVLSGRKLVSVRRVVTPRDACLKRARQKWEDPVMLTF